MEARNSELVRLPLLEAKELGIRIAGLELLRSASFELRRGEIVLLLGPSGTGKTILLKLLAGILQPGSSDLEVRGSLKLEGEDLLQDRPEPGRIGILFQDHALFDELTAQENVLFALHHRRGRNEPGPGSAVEQANALLDHLEVPSATALRYLSGGQLQRVALARTLALQPDLILYDEPTTGLDPTNAKRVAELIRDHGETRTSLIVTHDPRTLASIVDRAYLLNSETLQIEEVEVEKATSRLLDLGGGPLSASPQTQQRSSIPSQFLEKTGKVLIALTLALGHLLPTFPRWRYGWRSLRHSLSLTASVGSFAYVAMAGVIIGFVSTYFTFEHLPRRGFTEPLFVDDILRALGYLLYRVLAPVLLTLLVAARAGAAINSHIGNKVYARQLDGLRSLGVTPSRYLLTSSLWALLLAMPLLLAVMYLTARTLSLGVFIFTHPDQTYFFWDQNFHRSLRTAGETLWVGSWWLLLKVELCAFGIAAIAYFQGAREKLAAQDVSQSVTRTIIAASLYVLVVHFALAFLEF